MNHFKSHAKGRERSPSVPSANPERPAVVPYLLRKRVPLVRELALIDREIALAASRDDARGGFSGCQTPQKRAEAPLQRGSARCSGTAEGAQTPFRRVAGDAARLVLFFFLFCLGQPAQAGTEVPSPFGGAATAFLAEGELGDAGVGSWILRAFAAIGVISGAVVGWKKLIGKADEPQQHNVSGGPVTVRGEVEFVARPDFTALKSDVDKLEEEMNEMERRLTGKMDADVQRLNSERRVSIAGLHSKIEQTDRSNQSRFETILEKIGELRGQIQKDAKK